MDFRYNRHIRIISLTVLFFFCWTFGGIFDIVAFAAADSKQPAGSGKQLTSQSSSQTQPKPLKPEEKFQKTVDAIAQIVNDTATDTDTKKNKLKTKRSEIEGLDTAIKKQFSDTERFLKEKGLPPEILERHRKFVKHYEDNLNELKTNLDNIEKSKKKSDADAAIGRAKSHLEKVKPPKKHIPFDPNKLPHRTLEPVFKEPRLKPEEFTEGKELRAKDKEQKPILVAANGSLDGLLSQSSTLYAQSFNLPTDADLAETIEVQFTPEIQAIAQSLGYSPVKIYEYVRNNFKFEPYYGSLKGAQQTLLEKAGNDFDQVSLLITLLRASNIPARYVYGTVEIPIEDIKSWLGIDDTNMALTALASSGIPLTAITSGGAVSAVRLEHVWCQTFVSYGPSRGALEGSGDMWVDLDPSFKNIHKEIAENIDLPVFNSSQYLQSINQDDPVSLYETDIQSYLDTIFADRTTGAVKLQKEIEALLFEYLLGTLPYDVIVSSAFAAIPDNYRYKITFSVSDEETDLFGTLLTYTTTTPELAGKRVSLSYSPATNADSILIDKYGGLYNVPAYLLQLKPEIRINGESKASGSAIGFGKSQIFRIDFRMPYGKNDYVENMVTVGGYYVSVINPQTVPEHQVLVRTEKIRELDEILQSGGNVALDDYAGEIFYLTGLAYFQKLNAITKNAEQLLKVLDIKGISEAIVSIDVSVEYVFGTPLKVSLSSLGFDVDRNIHLPIPIDGNLNKKKEFMILSGMTSSFYEHKVLEEIYNVDSVSAIKIIQIANEREVPVYTLNSGNISSYINSLQVSSDVKTDILNTINAGMEVTIPQQELRINDWFGTGYIVMNPQTGAGAYMISGGLAGGSTTLSGMSTVLGMILSYHLSVVAVAEAVDVILCHQSITFPGEDNIDGTGDDKTYQIIDLIRLPKEERAKYYDPHDVGYNGVIKIDETNASDFLSYFVTLKSFQCDDGSPYLRVTPSIVWAIEHMAYIFNAVEEENSETSDYKRPKLGIRINDGYRTKSYHDNVIRKKYPNAAKNSYHMDGVAADIMVWVKNYEGNIVEVSGEILYEYAKKVIIRNNGGVGKYSNRVHIDVRGHPAQW